ncbi:hypothetical protein T02_9389 [Trichinella nativa]|uniref:Uncharacterized protein n=1 Tax=Trichinella nativa TaxID=6335 RepID=A0A0V1LLC7_9BILA|nr:hypothetical protein T02_9389 [Trichinella nativa]
MTTPSAVSLSNALLKEPIDRWMDWALFLKVHKKDINSDYEQFLLQLMNTDFVTDINFDNARSALCKSSFLAEPIVH